jgi:hypothetical protein
MTIQLHQFAVGGSVLTVASIDEEVDEDALDPCFFDPDYSLAAQTAYSVWEGASFFIQFLQSGWNLWNSMSMDPAATSTPYLISYDLCHLLQLNGKLYQQDQEINNKVLELGCGTGLVGLGLASMGAEVLLTDVNAVLPLIEKNIARNGKLITSLNHWIYRCHHWDLL